MIIGPNDTLYEGGFLRAELVFPPEYPLLPPKMRFLTKMWHPNIYDDGTVCISILVRRGYCLRKKETFFCTGLT